LLVMFDRAKATSTLRREGKTGNKHLATTAGAMNSTMCT
jgi:hypothetical protein